MYFVRFRDGKGIEHRAVRDDLGLMQQLGVIPAPTHEYVSKSQRVREWVRFIFLHTGVLP